MRTISSQNNFRNGQNDQNYYLVYLREDARAVKIRLSSISRTGFLRYTKRTICYTILFLVQIKIHRIMYRKFFLNIFLLVQ